MMIKSILATVRSKDGKWRTAGNVKSDEEPEDDFQEILDQKMKEAPDLAGAKE